MPIGGCNVEVPTFGDKNNNFLALESSLFRDTSRGRQWVLCWAGRVSRVTPSPAPLCTCREEEEEQRSLDASLEPSCRRRVSPEFNITSPAKFQRGSRGIAGRENGAVDCPFVLCAFQLVRR